MCFVVVLATDLAAHFAFLVCTFIIYICLLFVGLCCFALPYVRLFFFSFGSSVRPTHTQRTKLRTTIVDRGCAVTTTAAALLAFNLSAIVAVVVIVIVAVVFVTVPVVAYKLMYKCKLNDLNDLLYIFLLLL